MNPKITSAAESMLASTGRRNAVSESVISDNFPRKVNRPDSPERNGTCHPVVPMTSASTSKKNARNRHRLVPFLFELGDRTYTEPRRTRKGAFGTRGRRGRLETAGRAGRMAKAPVLKTGGRKPLQVRILCPPSTHPARRSYACRRRVRARLQRIAPNAIRHRLRADQEPGAGSERGGARPWSRPPSRRDGAASR